MFLLLFQVTSPIGRNLGVAIAVDSDGRWSFLILSIAARSHGEGGSAE
jgi:hypothetical protein